MDYYAKKSYGKFNVHLIAVHIGDSSDLVQKSADFMLAKVQEIVAGGKTPYDMIVLLGHDERWFQRHALNRLSTSEENFILENTDLIMDASDHKFRRHHELEESIIRSRGLKNTALQVNSGVCREPDRYWLRSGPTPGTLGEWR